MTTSHDVYMSGMTRTRVQYKISGFADLHHGRGTTEDQAIEDIKTAILEYMAFKDLRAGIADTELANIAGMAQAILERRSRERDTHTTDTQA